MPQIYAQWRAGIPDIVPGLKLDNNGHSRIDMEQKTQPLLELAGFLMSTENQ